MFFFSFLFLQVPSGDQPNCQPLACGLVRIHIISKSIHAVGFGLTEWLYFFKNNIYLFSFTFILPGFISIHLSFLFLPYTYSLPPTIQHQPVVRLPTTTSLRRQAARSRRHDSNTTVHSNLAPRGVAGTLQFDFDFVFDLQIWI